MTAPPVVELDRTPDLADLAGAARDAGHEVALIERPMPDAVSIVGIGRRFDLVAIADGVALEAADGAVVDREPGGDRIAAAARLWARLGRDTVTSPAGTGLVALGGFAFDPGRDPEAPWAGFPALLFRVPALAVTRVRGRTFASGDLDLLDQPDAWRGPAARQFELTPARAEADWIEAVAEGTRRLRSGVADKVVLAREVMARSDGVVAAASVARSLRSAHPSCFTFLLTGGDGTAFVGASPELLARRMGREVTSQPMAGTTRRGEDEREEEALAARLRASAKDNAEHRLTARYVSERMASLCDEVSTTEPEIVRLTTIQHLATTVRGCLARPETGLLDIAACLHPTPAINGAPVEAARQLIAELEGMERGWYTGAVGWMDGRGDGELAIAIRCGLLCDDGARLYAGNGMMPDSDPAAELEETVPKLQVVANALTT